MEAQAIPLEQAIGLVVCALLLGGALAYRWLGGSARGPGRRVSRPAGTVAGLGLAEAKRTSDAAIDQRLAELEFEQRTLHAARGGA